MGKDRDLREFSSTIAEVAGRLRSIVSDLDKNELNRELTLFRIRENAEIALRFMDSMYRALESDEIDQSKTT